MSLRDDVEKHFNELVIVGTELARVIGYAEDDQDCYLVVRRHTGSLLHWTMVGGYTYLGCLRGQNQVKLEDSNEIWDDYSRLDSMMSLNGAPEEKEFQVFIRK